MAGHGPAWDTATHGVVRCSKAILRLSPTRGKGAGAMVRVADTMRSCSAKPGWATLHPFAEREARDIA
jgi:hypothetical protein